MKFYLTAILWLFSFAFALTPIDDAQLIEQLEIAQAELVSAAERLEKSLTITPEDQRADIEQARKRAKKAAKQVAGVIEELDADVPPIIDPPDPPTEWEPTWSPDVPALGDFGRVELNDGKTNLRSFDEAVELFGTGGMLDGYGQEPVISGLVLDSVEITEGTYSALHRFEASHVYVVDSDLTAFEYAMYSPDALRDALFERCTFTETNGKEANVRTYDSERIVFRDCVMTKTLPVGAGYLKSSWRFYRVDGLWIDGGKTTGGAINIGEDNSPGSSGVCRECWITGHTIDHHGLRPGEPTWAIHLGTDGLVERLTLAGVTISSPNTEHAIIATDPTVIEIGPGCTFNGAPLTAEHVRWR